MYGVNQTRLERIQTLTTNGPSGKKPQHHCCSGLFWDTKILLPNMARKSEAGLLGI